MGKRGPQKDKLKRERAIELRRRGLTLHEIGKIMGISRERVRQLLNDSPIVPTFSLICQSCGKPFVSRKLNVKRCPECIAANRRKRSMKRCTLCGKLCLPFEMVVSSTGRVACLCKSCALDIVSLIEKEKSQEIMMEVNEMRQRIKERSHEAAKVVEKVRKQTNRGCAGRTFLLYLTDEEDRDLVEYLRHQPQGQRGPAFKELARLALREQLNREGVRML